MPEATRSRYIIRSVDDGPALAAFLSTVSADPALHVVSTVGPPTQPYVAIVETDASTAERLEASFREQHQLMIEPDRPLSLFG